ncbi:uncharacterized protein FOMMEDRAFT_159926 [Fomitiporia mediterranea MF3/22]|uniref:uncharacterized protein n=1 Tax=Fomitiporia mediterranea (strain MF3/22) TaxID=694068 RepID=UPI0004408191|nr:uncharacterized protein FOMMEDRAFT_159926 [Fomitiporia mediterranea MF3/22]EJD00242.1 hypothetical protein FOMMEDRAFT_159926 [Fomitiporia mediterranea MF3/22]
MPKDFTFSVHSRSSHSVVRAIINEHALATMSMYNHSYGTTLSLTVPIPRAFTSLCAGHDTALNRSSGPPLTPSEPNIYSCNPRLRSPLLRLHSFNAPDLNPGAPLTLAARRRGAFIFLIQLPTHANTNAHAHAHTLTQSISQPVSQAQLQPPHPHPHPHNHTTHMHTQFNLQGPSDDRSVVTKTTSNGPRTHSSSSIANAVRKRTRRGSSSCTIAIRYMTARSDIHIQRAVAVLTRTGSTADAVITAEPLDALAFWWPVWIWSRCVPGNRLPQCTRFLPKFDPIATSAYSYSHHGRHGHSHSLSTPLSFVLPENRWSTSTPGALPSPCMHSQIIFPFLL